MYSITLDPYNTVQRIFLLSQKLHFWLKVSQLLCSELLGDFLRLLTLPPLPTPKHVSCQKSAEYQLRLDPAEAMARPFLVSMASQSWQLFLPGRITHSKVKKERNCPVSDRISKRCDLTHHPKKQVYLALGRRET